MRDDLLIRTERRWHLRLLDAVATLLAWIGFTYLFLNGFSAVLQRQSSAQEPLRFDLLFATVGTLGIYFLVGLINALVLYSWALYNQYRRRIERRGRIPSLTNEQLRSSFNISADLHQTLRSHRICSVHHDAEGNIVGVSAGSVYADDGQPTEHKAQAIRISPASATGTIT